MTIHHIANIHEGLTAYFGYDDPDHIKDIKILKRKLEVYEANVSEVKITSKPNLKPSVVLNNLNYNANENLNIVKVDLSIMFNEIKDEILRNESLTDEETKEIIEKINEIEEISKSNYSKKEKWGKMRGCLNWLGTKGVDLAIKILPVIIAILKDNK